MPKTEPKKLLEVKHLNKTFKSKNGIVKAIDNVSFHVNEGEVVGLIGESGSGKTTIGRTIIGLHEATSGSIVLDGVDISRKNSKKAKRFTARNMQMIFQDPYASLNGQKNVLSIVGEPLIASKKWRKPVDEVLKNRNEVIFYFQNTLKDNFYKNYYNYANTNLDSYIKTLTMAIDHLNSFKINEDESIMQNFARLSTTYFDLNRQHFMEQINHIEKYEMSQITFWKECQHKIESKKGIPQDEKDLIIAKEKLDNQILLLKKSEKLIQLEAELRILNESKKQISDVLKMMMKSADSSLKSLLTDIKLDKLNLRNQKQISRDSKHYDHFAKEQNLVQKRYDTIQNFKKSVENLVIFDSSTVMDLFDESTKISDLEKLLETIKIENDKLFVEKSSQITDIDTKISTLLQNIKAEKSTSRDIDKQKQIVAKLKSEFDASKKTFYDEKDKFEKQFTQEFNLSTQSEKSKVNNKKEQLKKLQKIAYEKFDSIVKQLTDNKNLINYSQDIDWSDKRTKSEVKKIIKNFKDEISSFKIDIKNFEEDIAIQKTIYFSKFNFYVRRRTKSLVVKNAIYNALVDSGLKPSFAYRYPHEFSGGMRQRIGIARSIISTPKLIIADEPIAALDLSIQALVVNMLLDLKDKLGLAMIFIAHDLSMVKFNSDRVLIMHLGRIVEHGETDEIFNNPIHPYTKNLIASMPSVKNAGKGLNVSKFEPKYLEKYDEFNIPKYNEVRKGHFVLGTPDQIKLWKK